MGKLVKASKWRAECFEQGSRPSLERIAAWVRQGAIPGKIIGSAIYVDADEFIFGKHSDVKSEPVTAEQLLH